MLAVTERAKKMRDRTTRFAVALSLAFALTSPPSPASAATACPDVDTARELLAKAAAQENSRALEAARGQDGAASGKQRQEPSRDRDAAPPEAVRAAALVKEAETACRAGDKAAASEKAKAATALLQRK